MKPTKKSKKSKQQSSQNQFQSQLSDLFKKKTAKTRLKRGEGCDAKDVMDIILGFDQKESVACNKISEQFSSGITHTELKAIAELICEKTGLQLSRQAKRDDRVLHKWYDDNWDVIAPHVERINVFDQNHVLIRGKSDE
ncbi:hypothetical protein M9Y10_020741 [Tritrichomonas musculus]|uniref:Uncharacterized protein n=1 Tax=Tritrichomonas musculus TaxID=1915356 RepID=A0ABR2HFE4_9EUKA